MCSVCAGLTGPLDGDFELSGAGPLGEHLEVCGLLHPQAFGLQTPTLGFAEAGVACCGETQRVREEETYSASNSMTLCQWCFQGRRGKRCEVKDEYYIHRF